MSCPKDLETRAKILQYNSFSGFQAPNTGSGPNKFAICWCGNLTTEQVNKIKELSGSTTLYYDDYIGHEYMSIDWTEYYAIPAIFNAMLATGCWFRTNNMAAAHFKPGQDLTFTYDIMERKAIENIKELLKYMPNCIHDDYYIKDQYLDIWNYRTEEGKEFCKWLRQQKHKSPPDYDHEDNYFKWDAFKSYNPGSLMSLEAPQLPEAQEVVEAESPDNKKIKIEEEDHDNICMICLDKEPDTMVLPCEHRIVCKECSIGLRKTNDHHTCVRCRRAITNILE